MSQDTLFLHETPILRAFFKRLFCLLKGGHKHIYIGRVYLDTDKEGRRYSLHYACLHCNHFQWAEEVEK